jgi:hypothetical protein
MAAVDDPADPAQRRTMKEIPSQTGLDDFDAHELTDPEHHGPPAAAPPLDIEVALVHERGVSERPGQWRAFEVWTAKSVYAIDGQLHCFGVMDRSSGRADDKHAFLGARLMGGERKIDGSMSFSHPLPTPGSDAIFQISQTVKGVTRARYGHTSPVEKVVVRIRVTHAPVDSGDTLWEEITQTFRPLPG